MYRQAHCANLRNCEVGLRTRRFHILAGSVLTVWTRVENLLSSLTGASQFRLQIIRVKTDDNQKIVGCVIPSACLKQSDALLSSMSRQTYVQGHMKAEHKAEDEAQRTIIREAANNKPITTVVAAAAGAGVGQGVLKPKNSVYKVNSSVSVASDFEKSFENINYDFTWNK